MRFLFLLLLLIPTAQAADVNGYTAKYECILGGTNCNVDVATYTTDACAQTITTADSLSTINTKLNTGSSPVCITNGDYSAKGTITLTASGTSGSRRVMRYYRSGDTDDDPWDQSGANQAKMPQIEITGDYWIIHRLTFDGIAAPAIGVPVSSGVLGTIINRVYLTGITGTGVVGAVRVLSSNNATASAPNVLQNSVAHSFPATYNVEVVFAETRSHFFWFVNNESYNVASMFDARGSLSTDTQGSVVENNDHYTTTAYYTDCAGNLDVSGPCAVIKSGISIKRGGTSTNPIRIMHNRFYGQRRTDRTVSGGCCTSTGLGDAITWSNDVDAGPSGQYILTKNNIIMNAQGGLLTARTGPNHNSFIGNTLYHIQDFWGSDTRGVMHHGKGATGEFYLNTVIDLDTNYWMYLNGQTDFDVLCNVFIDANDKYTNALGSGTLIDSNVFYGTTAYSTEAPDNNLGNYALNTRANSQAYNLGDIIRTSADPFTDCTAEADADCFLYKVTTAGTSAGSNPGYTTTLGGTTTDGTMVVRAIRGPRAQTFNLRTTPVERYIPYAKVHNTATEYEHCTTANLGSALGSRAGVGVNDQSAGF